MNRTFLTLIKREFWENRPLWIAPLALAGLLVGAALFAYVNPEGGGLRMSSAPPFTPDAARAAGWASLTGVASVLAMGGVVTVFAYLLDCLFAERRDRSILFWKSLPVSDAQTVLAKLTVGMVVVPLGLIVLAVFTQVIVGAITWVRFESLRPYFNRDLLAVWPESLAHITTVWVFAVLWYAPVAAYLMLASVLAKRAPWTYAILPPVVLIVAEKLMFDTKRVPLFLGERLLPWRAMQSPELWPAFQDVNLWAGLAVAAGMLYIVIRLRRYRDDT